MVNRARTNPSRRPAPAAPVGGAADEVVTTSAPAGSLKETPQPTPAPATAPQQPTKASAGASGPAKAAPAPKSAKKPAAEAATPPSAAPASSDGAGGSGNGSGSGSGSGKKSQTPEFLVKLHRILQNEDPAIIHWDNGQIHVKNPTVLGAEVLHKYFRHSKYSSFQRQLNYFGFRKTQGKGKMSACTYTNVQLTHGNLKGLLHIKRKSSGPSGSGKDEEAEFEAALLAAGETDASDNDDDSVAEPSGGAARKRSGSAVGAGASPQQRKRARSSSASYATSVAAESEAGGAGRGGDEEDGEEDEDTYADEEEGSEGGTSAGAGSHSGYNSALSDHGPEDEEEEEGEEEEEEIGAEEADERTHARAAAAAIVAGERRAALAQQPMALSFTIGSRGKGALSGGPNKLSIKTSGPAAPRVAAAVAAGLGVGKLDVPGFFNGTLHPAPSPRGADDLFPSCLAAFDSAFNDAQGHMSPWGGWAEPPVSGSLSSLGSGATTVGSFLDSESSNHSFFTDDHSGSQGHGAEGGSAMEDLWAMAAVHSPRARSTTAY